MKKVLNIILFLSFSFLLLGCNNDFPNEPSVIETPTDEDEISKTPLEEKVVIKVSTIIMNNETLIQKFNETHPSITIELVSANEKPDVKYVEQYFDDRIINGYALDLTDYIRYDNEWLLVDETMRNSITYNGKVFALPFNQTYYGLYANCDLIGQYYDNVDKLLSEDFDLNRYIEIIKKTTNINNDSKTFGLLSTSDLINWLPSILDESGNTKHFLWNDKEKIIDFTAPFALEAFEIASDLYKYSWSSTDDYTSDPTQLFKNGKIAFSTSPSNYLTIYTNNVKFSSFPGGKIISVPHYLEISSDTLHPNEAFAVAKFLSYSAEGYHARMDVFEEEKGSSIMNFMPVITEDSVVSRWFSYSINKPYEKVFNEVIDGSVTVLLEPNLYVPSYQDARFYLNTGLYYDDIHGGADLKIGDFIWEVSIGNISVSDYAKYMTKELCDVLNKPIKEGYNSLYLTLN